MDFQHYQKILNDSSQQVMNVMLQSATYIQLLLVLLVFGFSFLITNTIRKNIPALSKLTKNEPVNPLRNITGKLGNLIFPLFAIFIMNFAVEISQKLLGHSWLVSTALTIALLLVCNRVIDDNVRSRFIAVVFRWIGLPLLFLHLVNFLSPLVSVLDSIEVVLGDIAISIYDVISVILFGSILFWLGRISNITGKELIRRQNHLDFRTKEVAAKLFEVTIFILIFLLLLRIMGINLTALAVFGGALGVGLGFGLQAIASNFISGIIILLDRSISVDDYIELEDGRTGVVRELTLRSTTLETFDGKDIMVPNEKFVTESFTNWTHKNKKQRYRVDFSVAYDSDIRKLVEIIKATVASHEQVISGEGVPFEEQPDCEIDGFGESGVNMFVEFWMDGIDDGKNRVGGDLLLMIFEAMRDNGFVIPFPQREVRVINRNDH
ncbi:mechanosensitive ion channel family protein [Vibrio rumoiensis]|uniref:Mechanosensitive ion channel protein n=1 Tax=Vibrio rumoiensis 1S-45 TaxID=1188252 RepID=A0A1E5E5P7_9VIBR|nr:mechanosensitive ion channel domain-containing protein [Vibrio rumoiensis]OEF29228.1 mechanosensitive ion channel protein [Vibrio rumoiensis 1S-45]